MNVPELILVVPCHNEEQNLRPLVAAIHATMDPLGRDFEVVITDDASTDN
jgi:glycosyltransferase involved in cell wall biosynthesis